MAWMGGGVLYHSKFFGNCNIKTDLKHIHQSLVVSGFVDNCFLLFLSKTLKKQSDLLHLTLRSVSRMDWSLFLFDHKIVPNLYALVSGCRSLQVA